VNEVGTDKTDNSKLSRRDFLREAGIVIGGMALTSIALSSACGSAETTNATTENTPQMVQSTAAAPATSSTALATSTPPASTAATVSTSTTPGTKPVGSTAPAITTGHPVNSNLLDIPGCSTKVAADRLYSLDNIWVKNMGNNVVQLGLSDQAQYLADRINVCSLSPIGTTLQREQGFGAIEADKMSFDLISPVSGKIVATNTSLTALPVPINSDAYGSGWMVNVQMTKPSELDSLVSPAYYVWLQAGKIGTAPSKR